MLRAAFHPCLLLHLIYLSRRIKELFSKYRVSLCLDSISMNSVESLSLLLLLFTRCCGVVTC